MAGPDLGLLYSDIRLTQGDSAYHQAMAAGLGVGRLPKECVQIIPERRHVGSGQA